MRRLRTHQGFTLVELMVGLALTVFLLLLAMPSASTYILDTNIRAGAQAYYDGAQLARAEALRRNADVAINLTDSGRGWSVTVGEMLIASKAQESASSLSVQSEQVTVTFDSHGRASSAHDVNFKPSNTSCMEDSGAQRCLRVAISLGGQVRLCDPSIAVEGDNRKC